MPIPTQPAKFRSCGPAGKDGCNDLEFNELGGTRLPGATGTKVPVRIEGPPDPVQENPRLPVASDTAITANRAPGVSFGWLTTAERDALWKQIQKGMPYDDAVRLMKFNKLGSGPGVKFELTMRLLEPKPNADGAKPTLLAESLANPMEQELVEEINELYRQYDTLCLMEFWRMNDFMRDLFVKAADQANSGKQGAGLMGWSLYKNLRPLYRKAGYDAPFDELNKIQPMNFLGVSIGTGVHPDLAKVLDAAAQKMPPGFRFPPGVWIGGFWPRAISDNKSDLSNHAVGKAIDIDDRGNPQFSVREAREIDEVLKWCKAQKDKGAWWAQGCLRGPWPMSESFLGGPSTPTREGIMQAYQKIKDNSEWIQAFLSAMLPMRATLKKNASGKGLQKAASDFDKKKKLGDSSSSDGDAGAQAKDELETSQNLEKLIDALGRAAPPVKPENAAKNGIVSLSVEVFIALWEAGARSGLEYDHKKDGMHFEVRPELDSRGKKQKQQ